MLSVILEIQVSSYLEALWKDQELMNVTLPRKMGLHSNGNSCKHLESSRVKELLTLLLITKVNATSLAVKMTTTTSLLIFGSSIYPQPNTVKYNFLLVHLTQLEDLGTALIFSMVKCTSLEVFLN